MPLPLLPLVVNLGPKAVKRWQQGQERRQQWWQNAQQRQQARRARRRAQQHTAPQAQPGGHPFYNAPRRLLAPPTPDPSGGSMPQYPPGPPRRPMFRRRWMQQQTDAAGYDYADDIIGYTPDGEPLFAGPPCPPPRRPMMGYDDDFEGEDDDDFEDEDILGNDDEGDDLDEDDFSGKKERLERKLNKVTDKIADLKSRAQGARRMKKRRLTRRIKRLVKKKERLEAKLGKIRSKERKSNAALAAAAAGGAGALGGAALARRRQQQQQQARQEAGLTPSAGGSMRFDVVSPPGASRLIGVPFYASGSDFPRTAITIASPGTVEGTATLNTEDLPYALTKMVGFTAQLARTVTGTATAAQSDGLQGLVRNLKTKGFPSLMLHDNWGDITDYDTDHDHLRGLRDYPEIKSPNVASVEVAAIGVAVDTIAVISCSLVVDNVLDDAFGPGNPGPYSR